MSITNYLKQLLCDRPPIAVNRRELPNSRVATAMEQIVPNWKDEVLRAPLDGTYWAPTKMGFRRLIEDDLINRKSYKRNKFDCEDYAINLMAACRRDYGVTSVGVVVDHSTAHAYNIVVFADGTAEFFEPQDDEFVTLDDEGYDLSHGVIWI